MTSIEDILHLWPILNSIALVLVGVVGVLIRSTLKKFADFRDSVDELNQTLVNLNETIIKLEVAFENHSKLDEIRFKNIEEELKYLRLK